MIRELVVDANIFGLAENPAMPEFLTCRNFLEALIASDAVLVVNDGFSLVEAENRSIIGDEYRRQVRYGTLGYALLLACAAARLRFVNDKVSDANRRFIKATVPRNTRDQLYVRVAFNSDDRVLASNDWDDFDVDARQKLRRKLAIEVLPAYDCLIALKAA